MLVEKSEPRLKYNGSQFGFERAHGVSMILRQWSEKICSLRLVEMKASSQFYLCRHRSLSSVTYDWAAPLKFPWSPGPM